ncbi:hypothetical protein RUM43_009885 [Polyplax serrata]|uniref:Uncharacterized protein n=1 Tax=Polyplax serrata TaxID=468196 RepID=A0AAN8PJY9_POLSC
MEVPSAENKEHKAQEDHMQSADSATGLCRTQVVLNLTEGKIFGAAACPLKMRNYLAKEFITLTPHNNELKLFKMNRTTDWSPSLSTTRRMRRPCSCHGNRRLYTCTWTPVPGGIGQPRKPAQSKDADIKKVKKRIVCIRESENWYWNHLYLYPNCLIWVIGKQVAEETTKRMKSGIVFEADPHDQRLPKVKRSEVAQFCLKRSVREGEEENWKKTKEEGREHR